MAKLFPAAPVFQGPLRPMRFEGELPDLEYHGAIPPQLDGAFYRCGPDPQFPPRIANDILINGDGVVSLFRFDAGRVDFRIRWVRTPRFECERAAGRALFGAYRNPYTDAPEAAGVDRTTGNTSVVWYAGKLLACKEDGLPFELDPNTLETRGRFDFGGALRCPTMTAHPETDPDSGEMWFYGFEARGLATPDTVLFVGDRQGRLLREDWFLPPYGAMIHDFAISQNHVILPIMPTTADLTRLEAGGDHWRWDGSKPTYIGVMPRDGDPDQFRWFEGPARWSFHTMNGFDDGATVNLDTTVAAVNGFFPDIEGRQPGPGDGDFYLTRWTCDLSGNEARFTERRLFEHPSDFYAVDPRYRTKPYRHGFMAAKLPVEGRSSPIFNALGHIDHATGEVKTWYAGPASMVQEPVFVSAGPDAGEGEGWLLAVVNRLDRNLTDLVIIDALALDGEPQAVVHIPMHLRMTFHGEFVARDALASVGAWR